MGIPLIGDIAGAIDGILDKFIVDKDQKLKAKTQVLDHLLALNVGQLDVNKAEAAHKSIFVAGWRPFIGWVCGVALAWEFIGQPVGNWVLNLWGLELTYTLPDIASNRLMELVLAMLGMAGLRTYEKRSGVCREK